MSYLLYTICLFSSPIWSLNFSWLPLLLVLLKLLPLELICVLTYFTTTSSPKRPVVLSSSFCLHLCLDLWLEWVYHAFMFCISHHKLVIQIFSQYQRLNVNVVEFWAMLWQKCWMQFTWSMHTLVVEGINLFTLLG